eukprot:CAMPEP_0185730450 /NCGR_PEP_ID=MMETSP1171-20130828/9880_1 /TAXON_ID=374046 /ORGANISM="Helicotheca tamensis, Strain CCMP826" /LENGTH=450 /DNA_ID=CAMNT_0028399491 /DNA_START=1 /DNA_END=1353 /DNA_ORIENTATION=-
MNRCRCQQTASRWIIVTALLLLAYNGLAEVAASSTTAPVSSSITQTAIADTAAPVEGSGGGGNPIVALAGYVKDSFVKMKDGTVELYTNHQKCNDIRSKQRSYAKLHNIKGRDAIAKAGGISYKEFDFLQKGKEDRGKLTNIVFMMFAAPNFLPYAIWIFPNMLPSPFCPTDGGGGVVPETVIQRISRERTHAVVQTMLDIERSVHVAPAMSKLNPFGKKATSRAMARLDNMGRIASSILTTNQATGSDGADLVLDVLENEIYTVEEPKKRDTALTTIPKPIIKGLSKCIEGQSSSPFELNFMVRGKVLNHLKKITDGDDFLVNGKVNLDDLDSDLLSEACSTRLIGGPNRSDEENRVSLTRWLEQTSIRPSVKTMGGGLHYNGNLARTALMCYHVVDGARDDRSSSYLPRLLFQGQYQAPPPVVDEAEEVVRRRGLFRRSKRRKISKEN